MRTMAQNAIEAFDPSPEERASLNASLEEAAADQAGDGLRQLSMELVSLAANRAGQRSLHDLSIDDVPAESALGQSIREREARRIEAELRAASIEGRPRRRPPPSTPAGRPVGTSAYDLDNPFEVLRANREGYFNYDDVAAEALNRAFEPRSGSS
jgi:hypothetical protein